MNLNHSNKAPCLAILGTGSDVGKSIVTTALCRYFANRGIRVAPFKSQNMSNNSGVTPGGLEMGRAQIVQAEAARIAPHVDMNPILLKPTSEKGAQVVLLGEAVDHSTAAQYHAKKEHLFLTACQSLDRLRVQYDLIIIEGAGSCAEVNLMSGDIVNFSMARYTDCPVILVGDIHKGGIFAQIVGTLECLPPADQKQILGFVINRFHGDTRLFEDGVRWIEQKTGKKVFGVLPWYDHITIEAEDSVVIENPVEISPEKIDAPAIAVIRLPHISNFTDVDRLAGLPGLQIYFVEKLQNIKDFKAIILPGSKNTRSDLGWLHKTGWAQTLGKYAGEGGHILGICGGYQMLGHFVHDPHGLEGLPGTSKGLMLLPVETTLMAPKTTTRTRFSWQGIEGTGYEIHMGRTKRFDGQPLFFISEQNRMACEKEDGCTAGDQRVLGTYIHGLFDTPGITKRWLSGIGLGNVDVSEMQGFEAKDRQYDLLADHFETYVNMKKIVEILGIT